MTKLKSLTSSVGKAECAGSARQIAGSLMKLLVRVVEARGLLPVHLNGSSDPFVKLQLGKRRAKTAVVKKSLTPVWDEEFSFLVGDVTEELSVSVLNEDKYFTNDLLGKVKVPLSMVMEAPDLSLGTAWYQLQPKSKKSKKKERGEICLRISLSTRAHVSEELHQLPQPTSDGAASSSDRSIGNKDGALSTSNSYIDMSALASLDRSSQGSMERLGDGAVDQPPGTSIDQAVTEPGTAVCNDAMANTSSVVEVFSRYFFGKPADTNLPSIVASDAESVVEQSEEPKVCSVDRESPENGTPSESNLDELLKIMESKDQGCEMPAKLSNGVLVDESYVIAPAGLNSLLFTPNSDFWPAVAELQGTSGFQIEPWKIDSNDGCLRRTLSYIKAASPQLSSEEQTAHLTVSWRINFLQSTMMKGMIESGAKQGMSEGSDHGVKAHGDGWLLTVALIEGTGILSAGSSKPFDLYAVFTCNTKRKTSSIKFHASDPKWNADPLMLEFLEIFEFDAMDDPPSRMDVAIHDSNQLDEAPIGHAEVNFLKSNLSDLMDIWVPLDGKCDPASNPKLHLRIFLNNSRGTEVVLNYLAKMGNEVGKKINLRSAQTNLAFRKLFNLPPEEFLIDDFTCHLKRKMPLQVESLMEMFSGGQLEHKVMQKTGCLDYSSTEWELVGRNIYKRQISYKFDKALSRYGGEASTTQQKYALVNQDGWAIEEVMTLQGVLLGDFFNLQLKYHMANIPSKPNTCNVQVLLRIAWLKSTKQQKKITKNIMSNTSNRLKEPFSEVVKDLTSRNGTLFNAAIDP
uniref:C2 and GRAM domain-containing protein n=1 Tax=Triticum aestivum TaxID=4565 RepID=A0A6G6C935_WHEAT|nr:C2 and GRAM domain-containing protein [Triticum aestivum]